MRISQLLILSPNGTLARQTFWELNRHTFHILSPPIVPALFSIHSHCFSFSIYFLHFVFMFLLLVFMSFHFNCISFHFDDPRSSMYNPMSLKRILNAKGTAFTWLLFTREQLYFIPPVPSSTSACNILIYIYILNIRIFLFHNFVLTN